MRTFEIVANGNVMGIYSGKTEEDAIQAYFVDAGYDSAEAYAESRNPEISVDEVLEDLEVTEISEAA